MDFSLLFVFFLVLVIWIVILGIYLYIARQQPTVAKDIESLESSIEDQKE